MLGDAPFDIWACARVGGYIILIKTFVVQLLIKNVESCARNNYSRIPKNADGVHVFFKKLGSKIHS